MSPKGKGDRGYPKRLGNAFNENNSPMWGRTGWIEPRLSEESPQGEAGTLGYYGRELQYMSDGERSRGRRSIRLQGLYDPPWTAESHPRANRQLRHAPTYAASTRLPPSNLTPESRSLDSSRYAARSSAQRAVSSYRGQTSADGAWANAGFSSPPSSLSNTQPASSHSQSHWTPQHEVSGTIPLGSLDQGLPDLFSSNPRPRQAPQGFYQGHIPSTSTTSTTVPFYEQQGIVVGHPLNIGDPFAVVTPSAYQHNTQPYPDINSPQYSSDMSTGSQTPLTSPVGSIVSLPTPSPASYVPNTMPQAAQFSHFSAYPSGPNFSGSDVSRETDNCYDDSSNYGPH
ncbi:hypothetical protein EV715DRAFT_204179 [Schizophyllum commune]